MPWREKKEQEKSIDNRSLGFINVVKNSTVFVVLLTVFKEVNSNVINLGLTVAPLLSLMPLVRFKCAQVFLLNVTNIL